MIRFELEPVAVVNSRTSRFQAMAPVESDENKGNT